MYGDFSVSTRRFEQSLQKTGTRFEYLRQLKQSDYFGEVALLSQGKQRTTQVTSMNYGSLNSIDHQRFLFLCERHPFFKSVIKNKMLFQYDDST